MPALIAWLFVLLYAAISFALWQVGWGWLRWLIVLLWLLVLCLAYAGSRGRR